MPDISLPLDFDIDLRCDVCGAVLEARQRSVRSEIIDVEPCKDCLDKHGTKEYDDGFKTGYADGESDARADA